MRNREVQITHQSLIIFWQHYGKQESNYSVAWGPERPLGRKSLSWASRNLQIYQNVRKHNANPQFLRKFPNTAILWPLDNLKWWVFNYFSKNYENRWILTRIFDRDSKTFTTILGSLDGTWIFNVFIDFLRNVLFYTVTNPILHEEYIGLQKRRGDVHPEIREIV